MYKKCLQKGLKMEKKQKTYHIFKIEDNKTTKHIAIINAFTNEGAIESAISRCVPEGEIWHLQAVCRDKLETLFKY